MIPYLNLLVAFDKYLFQIAFVFFITWFMKIKIFLWNILVHIVFWMSLPLLLKAQDDVLYFKGKEKKIGRVTEITQKRVEFQPENSGSTDKIDKDELELILFGNGSYLTFPNEYRGIEGPSENRHNEDWLLTKDAFIVACRIDDAEAEPMKVSIPGDDSRIFEVPRSSLVSVLFANGRRQLLGAQPVQIASVLQKKQMKTALDFLAPFEKKKAEVKPSGEFDGKLELDRASQEQLQKRGLQKTQDLGKYLNLIANKNTAQEDAAKAVDQAVALFLSDSSQVETKQPSGERRRDFIRNYLTRLRLLKYTKVVIEWSEVAYVSNLRRGPDGNYYGVISIQQKFTGFLDNKPVFSDNTRKNIEIVLKTYRKEVDGESVELWDVFLNNIGISDSKG